MLQCIAITTDYMQLFCREGVKEGIEWLFNRVSESSRRLPKLRDNDYVIHVAMYIHTYTNICTYIFVLECVEESDIYS